jgi:hypothetical protein
MVPRFAFVKASFFNLIKPFLTMLVQTRVIFFESMCDQMMKNVVPLSKLLLVETINTGATHCGHTLIFHVCLYLS